MKFDSKITFKVIDNKGKRYDSLASFLRIRQSIGSLRGTSTGSLKDEYYKAYAKLSMILDEIVADSVGAKTIPARSGRGAIFDNIEVDDDNVTTGGFSETKSIKVDTDEAGFVTGTSKISVATGKGINLSTTKQVITGVKKGVQIVDPTDRDTFLESKKVKFSNSFLSELLDAKGNQEKLKSILSRTSGPGSAAAKALRTNFSLKSSTIIVPVVTGSKAETRVIGWNWKQIVNNPRATIKVSGSLEQGVYINIVFSEALVRDALNKVNSRINTFNTKTGEKLAKEIADSFLYLSPKAIDALNASLFSSYGIKYESGSVMVYKGRIKATTNKQKKKRSPQQFISAAQWTALVRARLGNTMERLGAADPPDLKERTGRFRGSVVVSPDYRRSTLNYTYLPLYTSLKRYGYRPDLQIESAITVVAQQYFSKAFGLIEKV